MIRLRFVDDEEDIEHKKNSNKTSIQKKNSSLVVTLLLIISSISIFTVSSIVSNRENSNINEVVNKEETEDVKNSTVESKNINFPEVEFEYVEFNK